MRGGDIDAFEQLFQRLASALTHFALAYVDTVDDAEECVQVVFCWLWDHRYTLPQPRSIRSYLFAAVRNRALNLVRDRRTEAAHREQTERAWREGAVTSVSPAPDSEFAAREIEQALREALTHMSERCREVYTLRRDHGLRNDEVAEASDSRPRRSNPYVEGPRHLAHAARTVACHMNTAIKVTTGECDLPSGRTWKPEIGRSLRAALMGGTPNNVRRVRLTQR